MFSPCKVKTMRWRENPGSAVLMNVMPQRLPHRLSALEIVIVGDVALRPIWVGQGYPADVRAVVSEHLDDGSTIPVITARRMSSGARALLAEQGLSWADAAGYADITDGAGLHLVRLEPQPLRTRTTSDLVWSRSKDAVAEFLLSRRAQHPGLSDIPGAGVDRLSTISDGTALSIAQVAKVLTELDDLGYTTKVGPERGPTSSREFSKPGRLLSDWAGHHARSGASGQRAELHTSSREPSHWLSLLDSSLHGRWAVSGWVAADALAPLATSVPDITVYVEEDHYSAALRELTRDPEVTEVERAGRIRLRAAPEQVFEFARHSPIPMVSPVRIYADLLRTRGRGEDAAEHLREAVIGF